MAVGDAELGRQEHLVAAALQCLPEYLLRARLGIVGSGIEIGDPAIDRAAGDLDIFDATRAQRDVRYHGVRSTQPAITLDLRVAPLGTGVWRCALHLGQEKIVHNREPPAVAHHHGADTGRRCGHRGPPGTKGPQGNSPREAAGENRLRTLLAQRREEPRGHDRVALLTDGPALTNE